MSQEEEFQTIEQDWDRLYLEFPDIYDRFAGAGLSTVHAIHELFGLNNKIVLDIGSGTGRSSFALATKAKLVIGLEPWASMRNFAIEKARTLGVQNVAFVEGVAEAIPFGENPVDLVVSIYGFPFWFFEGGEEGLERAKAFMTDAARAVTEGGHIICVSGAPGDYAGELTPIICPERDRGDNEDSLMIDRFGFSHRDIDVTVEYGSLQEAIETYGFIYGRAAIRYLIEHKKTAINWKRRIYYRVA